MKKILNPRAGRGVFLLAVLLAACAKASLQETGIGRVEDAIRPPSEPAELSVEWNQVEAVTTPLSVSPPRAIPHEQTPIRSILGTISESILGDAYAKPGRWTPLPLSTFLSEGWSEPFVTSPTGTGGAARGGWINGFDGVFFRAWFLDFAYLDNFQHNGTVYAADYRLYVPFNRRFEVRIDVPFLVANRSGPANRYQTSFGDFTVSPRFLLSETENFSQVFALNIRTPTGLAVNANSVGSVTPHYQFWANPAGPWILRGGTGLTAITNHATPRQTTGFANLGIGQFFAREDAPIIRDFYWYVVANVTTTVDRHTPNRTFVSLSPGIRFALSRGHMWHFLAAVETPVSGPLSFTYAPVFLLLKDY